MKKGIVFGIIFIFLIAGMVIYIDNRNGVFYEGEVNELEGMVISISDDNIFVMDKNDIIYRIMDIDEEVNIGDMVMFEYSGISDDNLLRVVGYSLLNEGMLELDSEDIFGLYYKMAGIKTKEMTLDEKIGQLLIGRYNEDNAINDTIKYGLGGFVFYEEDFIGKTKKDVVDMIDTLQNKSKIPLLTAVDEEGGSVVRISSNPNLVSERFKSPRELYLSGGMDLVRNDTINKSKILFNLGINLNLAPVVDVSTDINDYIYKRSIGEGTNITSLYAKTVINASKGLGVSYTLKHFPGYGNNDDTHKGIVIDNRSYDDIMEYDIPPFEEGINNGAEAVLISHNIVKSIDPDNPASLSKDVHNLLRGGLGFSGIAITDDLSMEALVNIENVNTKAILSGNNLIISTDYVDSFNEIKNSVMNGVISEELIDRTVTRVLAWKYYKGLMKDGK
ncbi:MAG: beta-hexosaminidase [Bacilli bacterium]|nr:beta-hexosaminidase [Bacilli bacterium]